ncbi:MAG: hypothetical protein HDR24_03875 [Lachnospiraceae bacterium]|nr:hypothetical protein [Lachnospiraceae bacterium]
MEQREFLKIIQSCRRRMNIAGFLEESVSALSIGAGIGILFQAAAFLTPLYYVNIYIGLTLLLAEMSVLAVMLIRRTTMEQAALVMDGFGFEERIVTAYEHLDQEGTLIELQREDAMKELSAHRNRIQISVLPSWKKIGLCLSLFVLLTGLSFIPSVVKERAAELHNLKEEVKKKEDEIEEMVEALEQLKQEKLTRQQQETLSEMAESLESSLSEYRQAVSQEMLEAASQKLDYKYEIMSDQLSEIMRDIEGGASISLATADALKAMEDKMKELNKMKPSKEDGTGQGQGSSGEGNNGDGSGQGNQDGSGSADDGDGQGDGGNGQGDGNGQDGEGGAENGRGTGSSNTPHDYVSVPNAIADSGNLTGNATNHDTSEYFRAQTGLSWEGTHTSYDAVIGSYEQNAYEGIAAGRYPSGMEEIIKEYFASFD